MRSSHCLNSCRFLYINSGKERKKRNTQKKMEIQLNAWGIACSWDVLVVTKKKAIYRRHSAAVIGEADEGKRVNTQSQCRRLFECL